MAEPLDLKSFVRRTMRLLRDHVGGQDALARRMEPTYGRRPARGTITQWTRGHDMPGADAFISALMANNIEIVKYITDEMRSFLEDWPDDGGETP